MITRGAPLAFWSWLWSRLQETVPTTPAVYIFQFWDSCFVSCETIWPTNKQTRLFGFVLASPRIHPVAPCIVPCAVMHKRGQLEIEFGFQQNQKLISDFEGCHYGLLACVAAVRPLVFRVCGCARTITRNNEQGGNASRHLSHCIRVIRTGFPWCDISSCRDHLLNIRARPNFVCEEVRKAQWRS